MNTPSKGCSTSFRHWILTGLTIIMFVLCRAEIIFFDTFEDGLNSWQAISVTGDRPWDVNGDGDPAGGPSARFQNNYDPPFNVEDDWLVLGPVSINGESRVEISFMGWHIDNGALPALYYTDAFNGNPSESSWTELACNWGDPWQWAVIYADAITDPPANLYFAFHYTSSVDAGAIVQFDDFSVNAYTPLDLTVVGESAHFRFLTDIPEQENFWEALVDPLESSQDRYDSIWNRVDDPERIPVSTKVDVVFTYRENVPFRSGSVPEWKCASPSYFDDVIYLSPILREDSRGLYGDLAKMAEITYAQFALIQHYGRWGWDNSDDWFTEAFGFYEAGIVPNLERVRTALANLGTNALDISLIQNMDVFLDPDKLELALTYVESRRLTVSYYYMRPLAGNLAWDLFLDWYYVRTDSSRWRIMRSTEWFDIYGSDAQLPFIERLVVFLEDEWAKNRDRYSVNINHRFRVGIFPKEMLKEVTGISWAIGVGNGVIGLQMIPLESHEDLGLVAHEFMHVMVAKMANSNHLTRLLNEGLADFAAEDRISLSEVPLQRWKAHEFFNHYRDKYGRDPTIDEVLDNTIQYTVPEYPLDPYFYGQMFWTFIYDRYQDYALISEFLASDRDWSIFPETDGTAGEQFMQYLKEVTYMGPPLEAVPLPFEATFEGAAEGWALTGWTMVDKFANDMWQEGPHGVDGNMGSYIQHPYFTDEKEVDSWMVSPPLDVSTFDELVFKLDLISWGEGPELELYYTDRFHSATTEATWTRIPDAGLLPGQDQWETSREYRIPCQSDRLYLGIRYTSSIGDNADYHIDNIRAWGEQLVPPALTRKNCHMDNESGELQVVVEETDSRFVYLLESSSDLMTWSPLGDSIIGTGGEIRFDIGPIGSCDCDYFRVRSQVAD
ncbi:MAG: choice-of-anchor J domain-containing protein [Puniceicoccaceae bacterium]